jgi:hypothetical protein
MGITITETEFIILDMHGNQIALGKRHNPVTHLLPNYWDIVFPSIPDIPGDLTPEPMFVLEAIGYAANKLVGFDVEPSPIPYTVTTSGRIFPSTGHVVQLTASSARISLLT